ncbi:hypothetical protein glysoja_046407 [Glycine soja]|uniref:Uncharacterized protein n=1 Tax=Glycine soja TaxID=3848 RepID=A0A0B2QXU7_GLYSO|nr:hypothetical protein glysoja_046407 [Glycine soja]
MRIRDKVSLTSLWSLIWESKPKKRIPESRHKKGEVGGKAQTRVREDSVFTAENQSHLRRSGLPLGRFLVHYHPLLQSISTPLHQAPSSSTFLCLDLEKFDEVMLPECLARSSSDCVLLCVVKGSHRPAVSPFLIVCHFPRMNGRPSSCQIWELTKFDRVQFWSNIYDFSIDELGIYPHFFYSVGGVMIRNRRGSLLIIVQGQLVYSLDLETQILIQLPIAEGGLWTLYPAYYAESLFLLDKLEVVGPGGSPDGHGDDDHH